MLFYCTLRIGRLLKRSSPTSLPSGFVNLAHQFNPLRAWLLTMGMTDGLQQSFPLSQSLLLIPLALGGRGPEDFGNH